MIKSAIVGYGYIGKRHAEILHHHKNTQLAVIVDVDEAKLQEVKEKYPTVKTYSSLEEALANEHIDVLHICTPNGLHYEHSKIALQNNINVLCEKPVSLYYEQIEELISLAKSNNIYFESVLQNRLSPTSQYLKHIIRENKLNPFYVKVDCFWNRDRNYYSNGSWRGTLNLDGGVLYTQFSHFVDIIVWLFGEIVPINVNLWNFNHKYLGENWYDSGNVVFTTVENNITGVISFSTSCYKKNLESAITILGDKGTIKIGGQYMEKLKHLLVEHQNGTPNLNAPKQNSYPNWQGSANNHKEFIELFYDRIINNEVPNYENIENASLGIKFIETVYKGIKVPH